MKHLLTTLPFILTLASALPGAPNLETRQEDCGTYTVPQLPGGFRTRQFIDFSTASPGQNTQQVLSENGLYISNWPIPPDPPQFLTHTFTPANVNLVAGALALKVSAYPGSGDVMSAEIGTTAEFRYASVRTVLKSKDGQGEIDFEILTSTVDSSELACVPPGIWATLHAPGKEKVSKTFRFPFDPRDGFHEYRMDWSPNTVRYYMDGEYIDEITENVPQIAGSWLWNTWSSGDPCWSGGPPTEDSTTLIRSITIYKDYLETETGEICPV